MPNLTLRLGVFLAAVLVCLGLVRLVPAVEGQDALARQSHAPACADCHGADFGGRVLVNDMVIGRIVAPNLTRGGAAGVYSRDDWYAAIHDGVGRDGRRLILMPAAQFADHDRADVAMLTSRLGMLKPVQRELPAGRLGPIGRALHAASPHGLLATDVLARFVNQEAMPEPGSAGYGAFLADVGCVPCHGQDLRGARITDSIVGPDLGPGGNLGAWTEEDFLNALRTGRRPDGSALGPAMPVHALQDLDQGSVSAIWLRLRAASGGR
ncbi:MAG: hypothetical protein WEB88_03970 [Gemmatimonadota bacterium]